MDPQTGVETTSTLESLSSKNLHRRKFLLFGGGIVSAAALLSAASCKKDDVTNNNTTTSVDLGSGDTGILNYAYALEQLEAAFYTQVVLTPYAGITTSESNFLKDIRDHEIAHREFFKNALSSNAIAGLEVDFSTIDFTKRDNVLATAKAFEDLGVSAYNGAGHLLQDANLLLLAGKIVSVEARHAALIRDLIMDNSFADSDVVNAQGLDVSRTPIEVLSIAGKYVKTTINSSNLPK